MTIELRIFNGKVKLKTILNWVLLLFVIFIQFGCANESVPQGGAQDKEPPKVKKITPPNKSLHFSSDKIEIKFNEFLKASGFSQTLISPPMDKRPDFHIEGRTLTIKFKSQLRPSTTYTINFGDDIQDLNEGNKVANFTYVFSTGDYIDSQKVSGTVLLAKDNSASDGMVVSLYPKDSVDGILKSRPYYFAKTDKGGHFEIDNIRADKYLIYALKDQNYNYLFDQPNELIAFSDSIVNLTDTLPKQITLYAFEDDRRKLALNETRSLAPGLIRFVYSKPLKSFKLDAALSSEVDFAYLNTTKDTVTYWYSKYYTKYDTLYLTANSHKLDTVRMELHFIEKDSLEHSSRYFLDIVNQPVKSKLDTSSKTNLNLQELNKPLKINFSRPVIKINETKQLQILEDSTNIMVIPKFILDEKTKQFISVEFDKKENTHYTLEMPDSMFQGFFGTWNKKTTYRFTTNAKSNYGNLRITLKTEHPENYYIIRLLNATNDVVKEFLFSGNGERKVSAENILAGNYKFVVIDDTNKNGEWDSGEFKNKIRPEKIFPYKDTYQLKGGWDLDVEVKF